MNPFTRAGKAASIDDRYEAAQEVEVQHRIFRRLFAINAFDL
jgi:hypothetical protein